MPKKDVPWSSIFISLPSSLKERVMAEATSDHRSMSQWIQVLIARHFEAKDKECGVSSLASSSGMQGLDSVSSPLVSNPTSDTNENGCNHPNHPHFPDHCLIAKGGW